MVKLKLASPSTGVGMNEARSRILVVDDEHDNRRLLESVLVKAGHEITMAENGETALTLVQVGRFDLVLLDVMMPGMDGIKVCRTIREDFELPLLPVVLVTALSDRESRTRGKAAGADEYLTRPVHHDELLARVRSLLNLKRVNDALAATSRVAHLEARRWRIVSRVAAGVGAAASLADVGPSLVEAISPDVPLEFLRLCFDGAEASDLEGSDGVVAIPLGLSEQGALYVRPRAGYAFSEDDLGLFNALSPHLANAVARSRFNEAQGDLEMARRRLSQLIVHDLKNPLASIKANLEYARHQVSGDVRAALEDSRYAAAQLQAMLLDFLDVGRAEDGRLPCKLRPGDLAPHVAAVADGMRAIVEGTGAGLEVRIASGLPVVDFDPSLVSRVVQNLLTNAARFARKLVEVEVRIENRVAVVSVANDGPRIPDDVRPQLFEKYGQLNASQGSANRGLGLYLCRLVADRHGGSIVAVDRDVGACFELRLPLPRLDECQDA
ncbi:response regulator [Brevundimonas sp.]|uniref:response regulator n=1 Tax=Brevundimonas sp. TaxID=1871086 RepID=UPI0027305656|nr:response regulator [Brevundimonas sp.]MDP1913345.1 response regulator [Brevundimonas sp.]